MNPYIAADEPELVEFGPARGLSVSGQGEPGGAAYNTCAGALYAVAGSLCGVAARNGRAFDLPPLEGRWWVEDERSPFDVPREEWHWHLFLRLPDTVEDAWYDEARQAAPHPAAPRVQLVTYTEGRCVQVLHRGAYADEPRTLARMDAYLEQEGLTGNGLHHEVYLSDVRETDPEKMRTILRMPVRPSV
ncbi:GyrI-like domain-containing protein [Actinoallomurus spadix]|uniref:GyrI-like domain-containing protein n=1 Tax=Actinoallomurus spadix TaxID=79912 RepID=UPI0020940216|nr:GyrI-like domain-containing protein [Actinoallomurus spadix]MCO5991158.1 GyrI-like domain-containing protein [Actinoallomurus spadix]